GPRARATSGSEKHVRTVPSRTLPWLALAGAWLAVGAAPAGAATATINSSPLTITADDTGIIQVTFTGSPSGEFLAQPNAPAYAGLTAALRTSNTQGLTTFSYTTGGGFRFTPTAGQPPTVTDNGNQHILTAQFDASTPASGILAHVAEQIVYVDGT